mmetsp:Transcript_5709/g.7306  ORF Transcript_5709/g.7306 Transcript_5709/m.7306 type:complete len:87 (-) Transcript_5709:6-266(-)
MERESKCLRRREHCVVLPQRSTPSSRMNAPLFFPDEDAIALDDADDNSELALLADGAVMNAMMYSDLCLLFHTAGCRCWMCDYVLP